MPPSLETLTAPASERVRRWVLGVFPRDRDRIDYEHPEGDPGLFGPDSATWRIHADFPGMLSGGLCALMLQVLHPLALAGVWDHSNFRTDLVGRLRRTTAFVAGTTYGARADAEALIARVARIHAAVRGVTADGRPYSAADPELLTWVHVTEAYGFLEGYRRYAPVALPATAADRYYDEVRRVAERLGARDVPASENDIAAYFARLRAELRFDARSREVLAVLARIRLPVPLAGVSRDTFLGAGAALLPEWAQAMLAHSRWQRLQAGAASRVLRMLAPMFRTALPDGIAPRACRRVGVAPEILAQW
ncbi:MAG TPA: oxygenase MpaB family protein [Dokdonella sp.]|nr:oxygenase MpaB family protein [Dokdonella sp.]